jgi:chromosome segregation ATPase
MVDLPGIGVNGRVDATPRCSELETIRRIAMPEQQEPGFMNRIGSWFKRGSRHGNGANGDLPLMREIPSNGGGSIEHHGEVRNSILRPWARRDAAISNLQEGFRQLTDLMGSIRSHLENQTARQDELVRYLSHLPQALESLPESSRLQSETLKVIYTQLETQNGQQRQLTDILKRLGDTGAEQRDVLNDLRDRVETLDEHDQKIADNLSSVGAAMQTVSRNSHTSAQVLEQLRDNQSARDGTLERILAKQNTRFTTMLTVAIVLSVAALVAVSLVGYLLLNRAQ